MLKNDFKGGHSRRKWQKTSNACLSTSATYGVQVTNRTNVGQSAALRVERSNGAGCNVRSRDDTEWPPSEWSEHFAHLQKSSRCECAGHMLCRQIRLCLMSPVEIATLLPSLSSHTNSRMASTFGHKFPKCSLAHKSFRTATNRTYAPNSTNRKRVMSLFRCSHSICPLNWVKR